MKNKKLLLLTGLMLLFTPIVSFALESPPKDIDIETALGKIQTLLIAIAIPIATICVIISGFYFMTAQGDPGKIDTAKKMLFWALVGTAVVLLADAMVQLVKNMI